MGRIATGAKWLLGGWAAWRVFGPEPSPKYTPGQERPVRIPGRSVFVGEKEFFVRETGPAGAPVLVLVHGWALDGEMTFYRIAPALADRYRVVIPDHRNHGRSEWIRGRFDVDAIAEELAGVLDVIGVSGATLFGWSMGGMATQELALRRPDLVDRIILGGTAAFPVPRHRALTRSVFWLGRAVARISRYELASASDFVFRKVGAVDQQHRRWLRTALLRRDPTLYYEAGAAAWRFDSREWVKRVEAPALVIIPTEDQLVPAAAQHELAALLPNAEVVELVGGGHESILNRPDEIIKAIDSFVQA